MTEPISTCPECGVPLADGASTCLACGFRVAGGASAAETNSTGGDPASEVASPPPVRMQAAMESAQEFEEVPPDGLRYKAVSVEPSGIKIRRDGPAAGAGRPGRERKEHDPDSVPSASGATPRPSPNMIKRDGPSPSNPQMRPVRRPVMPSQISSRWATAGLITALLAWIPVFAPLAILFGALGVREVKKGHGLVTGMGRSIFALLAGGVATAGWIGLLFLVANGAFSGMAAFWERAQLALHMSVLEQLPQAQETFRSARYADEDGDGRGEYGTSQQLTTSLQDFDLSALEAGALGWKLTLVVPRGVNRREKSWWAFMEPTDGEPGKPWLYIDESQILRRGDDVKRKPSRRLARTWPAISTDQFIEEMSAEG